MLRPRSVGAGLLHMYIHLMEMSPHPQAALRAADDLCSLVPDAGHLEHMSTHIDVLCGHYQSVVTSNSRAIVADRRFLEREGAMNFYSLYRVHNYHFKLYGAMFLGQYRPALEAVEELAATIPEALLRMESPPMANWLEGYMSMKPHVYIRFGKWHEILNEPLPEDQDLFCVTTAILHYAKGRLGKSGEATMVKLRLDLANARADTPIQASCFCRLQHVA